MWVLYFLRGGSFLYGESLRAGRLPSESCLWQCRGGLSVAVGGRLGGILILKSNTLGVKRTKRFSCSNSRTLGTLHRRNVHSMLVGPGVTAVRASRKVTSRMCFLPIAPCFMARVVGGRRPSNVLLTFKKRATLGYNARLCRGNVLGRCNMRILKASMSTVVCARSHSLFIGGLGRGSLGAPIDHTMRGVGSTLRTTHAVNCPIVVHSTCTLKKLKDNVYPSRRGFVRLTRDTFAFSPRVLIRRSLGN